MTEPVIVPRANAPASTYIGHGVYASFDGSTVCIHLGQPGGIHGPPIYLGPEDLGNLFEYATNCLEALQRAND